MKNVMSNLAEAVYYIFTSWLAGSIAVMALGGAYLVWKDYRYSKHLKKTSKHRLAQNKAKEVARFEKELEAYEASTEPDGYENEFFGGIIDLIESDPSYRFKGAQDLGHSYLPNPFTETDDVDNYFENPELAVDDEGNQFFEDSWTPTQAEIYQMRPDLAKPWVASMWKPNYTQRELDQMFHKEYTEISESSPENRVVDTPLQIETYNAFQAVKEEEGFHEKLEELLNVNGRPDEEDR